MGIVRAVPMRADRLTQMRLGAVHNKLLPHFYLRRDKRLIAHEVGHA